MVAFQQIIINLYTKVYPVEEIRTDVYVYIRRIVEREPVGEREKSIRLKESIIV